MNIFALQTTSFLPAASVAGPAIWFEADAAFAAGDDYFVDVPDPVAGAGTLATLVWAPKHTFFGSADRRVAERLAQQLPALLLPPSSQTSAEVFIGRQLMTSLTDKSPQRLPEDYRPTSTAPSEKEDTPLFRGALAVYAGWQEGLEWPVEISGDLGWGR
ncbi:MAG: hypothetical protein HY609_05290 [Deltaproteobacteria bacterium]|nr:hypothetical protein [Deltaproteobacteria bacterium]MBI4224327.1 hypothetical protein [Deltaproteobacteria bacterium]